MTAIFALPQEWDLFDFGTLHGHDAAPVAIVAVVVVALLETIKRFWLVRLVG